MADDPYAAPDPYATPEGVDPTTYGWEPIPPGAPVPTAARTAPAARTTAAAMPAPAHVEFPAAAAILLSLGVALVAIVRIESLWDTLDFADNARTSLRLLLREVAYLLLAGTAVLTGALAAHLSAGAKAALVLVGILLLSPTGLLL